MRRPAIGSAIDDCTHAVSALEQPLVAGDQPQVEQRQQELGVAGVGLVELVELADVVADREADVPQRLQQRVDEALLRRRDRLLDDDQQIDIRMQTRRPPAVAAKRADDERRAGVLARRFRQLLDDRVDLRGVACLKVAAAAPGGRGRLVFRTRRRQRRAHLLLNDVRARRCGGQLRPVRSHG